MAAFIRLFSQKSDAENLHAELSFLPFPDGKKDDNIRGLKELREKHVKNSNSFFAVVVRLYSRLLRREADMKFLIILTSLFFSQISFSAVITQVPSDWATFRIDLVAEQNYTVFGGGNAGDVFHAYFDFNKAYLPYITQINSEYQSVDFAPHLGGYAPDNTTAAPDDFLDFDALPLVGSFMRFEINGLSINSVSPFLLNVANGQIDSLTSSIYGGINGFLRSDSFLFTDHTYQMEGVFGHIAGIVDTSLVSVDVPEPGIQLLLLLPLMMFGVSRVIPRKRKA